MKIDHLNNWLIIAVLTLLTLCMLIIIKHHHADAGFREI
jgi:hypothetical protein